MHYLDNCATTKPHKEVLDTFIKINESLYFNPASPHEAGLNTMKLLETARAQIKKLLKLNQSYEVIFTSGATESNNLAITGMARAKKAFGKTIITSKLEHPSVLETVRSLESEGFEVKYVKFKHDGMMDMEHFESLLNSDVVLVSLMHVNNVMGAVLPIESISRMLKHYPKVHFHVDAVQSIGKINLDWNCADSIAISGHKFNGLKGQGLLVLNTLNTIKHIQFGGGQEFTLRSGTVNTAGAVSLAKAMRLAIDRADQLRGRLYQYKEYIEETMKHYPGIKVNSQQNGAPHIVNVSFTGVKGEVIVNAFSKRGIMVSTTSACSSRRAKLNETLTALHVDDESITGSIRISMDHYTEKNDIDALIQAFEEIYEEMKELLHYEV